MPFTHALATNRYGEGDLIVSTSASNGTHTTLTSAIAAATSGQTIFLRDSVTEDVTLTPGVNIAAWSGSSLNVPSITGTITMTGAGTSNISGVRLVTNSAPVITVSGNAASILNLDNCYFNATNNTAISYTSSSSSSQIFVKNCRGDLGTTGIAFVVSTAAGEFRCHRSNLTNSGGSTTASSTSTSLLVFRHCDMPIALSATSTGSIDAKFCNFDTTAFNATAVTTAGTGISSFADCDLGGGTASSVSIGSGTTVRLWNCGVNSSNTNVITGAGTFIYNNLTFLGSSFGVNATTNTSFATGFVQSWTPAITFGGGNTGITYTTQIGTYIKTGNLVYICARVTLSNKGSSTGVAALTGLPYAAKNTTSLRQCVPIYFVAGITLVAAGSTYALILPNGTTGAIDQTSTVGAQTQLADTAFSNTTDFHFEGFYISDT